jgi:hypothetical protein
MERLKNKIGITSDLPFSKRYLKVLDKKVPQEEQLEGLALCCCCLPSSA